MCLVSDLSDKIWWAEQYESNAVSTLKIRSNCELQIIVVC